jgi:Peptidase A4 family
MGSSRFRGAAPLLAVIGLLFASPAAFAAGAPNHSRPNRKVGHSSSTNWSGYAVTGFGPYQSVSASWIQPAVDCAKTRNGYAAFWVGLDGYSTDTVEQTGTEADCSNGTAVYGAWYEMYPRDSYSILEAVSPGDSFTASVTYLGKAFFGLTKEFELTLSDTTKGWSKSEIRWLRTAQLGSAEAIAEAPSSLTETLPLADFETVGFSGLTVDGSLVSSSTPGVEPISMVSEAEALEAEPSAISDGSFTDTWYSA